jgi:hypothetical protein
MKKILISLVLVLAFAATSYAVPVRTAEMGNVPERGVSPAQDVCYIGYYNFCSGWVYYWSGYCYCMWDLTYGPAQYGVCFDLADCDDIYGPLQCRSLTDVWWACKRFTPYGLVNIEIYPGCCCFDPHCCPWPLDPLCGVYGYVPDVGTPWQHFVFDPPCCLSPCDTLMCGVVPGHFIVMVTDLAGNAHTAPYSDINAYNIDAGCELDWRCVGHSYVYHSCVTYCDVYGTAAPMWVSGANYGCTNFPLIPPGCHNYLYSNGFFTEWLIDVYIACLGPTATEDKSWSEIKALYK